MGKEKNIIKLAKLRFEGEYLYGKRWNVKEYDDFGCLIFKKKIFKWKIKWDLRRLL